MSVTFYLLKVKCNKRTPEGLNVTSVHPMNVPVLHSANAVASLVKGCTERLGE